ncbi:MAG: phosphoribosylglycinamide formyltransferase [Hyphomicrobiales bacterium]|nr:MAG: phosphoribosylglycinamide formyltransferase [Hyphomicrobiales bacterium]
MTGSPRKRVAVLISGRGSNMMALVNASRAADYPAEIALVISNKLDAAGLAWAREQNLQTAAIDHKAFPSRESFDAAIDAALVAAQIDYVAQAGFMRIQTAGFVEKWAGRQINIHPSLLPLFKGLHPQRQALEAGVRVSGASVHFVTPELDSGPIIAQGVVPVVAGDTEDRLAERILAIEHRIYPAALALVVEGKAKLVGGRVSLEAPVNQRQTLVSPGGERVC